MLEREFCSSREIADALSLHYGIQADDLVFLPLGAEPTSASYKAHAKGKWYFVKVRNGPVDVPIAIAKLLSGAGLKHVILPIPTLKGIHAIRLGGFTMIVYPFIEGQDGFTRALTDGQWLALGKAVRQIHEAQVPLELQHQIRREEYSPRWRDEVKRLLDAEPKGDKRITLFLQENKSVVRRLADRAEELAKKAKGMNDPFVLCHADLHGGNVLIGPDEFLYIVDWDDPIMAPKERDLMFVGGGVANVWNKPREVNIFYRGYGPAEVDKGLLAYYRHERIVEDIAVYCQELFFAPLSGKDREMMHSQFFGMFEPNGVVEIAFETDG